MTQRSEPYALDRVTALLQLLMNRGTFGSTEIFWGGHEIIGVKHHETIKPHELPPVAQPT